MIEQEVANAKEVRGLSRILVKLLTSHKDVSPFHIQTMMHWGDLNKLRDDEMLKARLEEILANARDRPDLGAAAQKLLQVRQLGILAHIAWLSAGDASCLIVYYCRWVCEDYVPVTCIVLTYQRAVLRKRMTDPLLPL